MDVTARPILKRRQVTTKMSEDARVRDVLVEQLNMVILVVILNFYMDKPFFLLNMPTTLITLFHQFFDFHSISGRKCANYRTKIYSLTDCLCHIALWSRSIF